MENTQFLKISLNLCQINLDLYETLNLSSWGTNQSFQVVLQFYQKYSENASLVCILL